jgi:hypothetical protein
MRPVARADIFNNGRVSRAAAKRCKMAVATLKAAVRAVRSERAAMGRNASAERRTVSVPNFCDAAENAGINRQIRIPLFPAGRLAASYQKGRSREWLKIKYAADGGRSGVLMV